MIMKNLQQFLCKMCDSQVSSDSTTSLRFPYDPDTISICGYRIHQLFV